MDSKYTTPLAKTARIMEIFIPGYMFGKAWGIANEPRTVEVFRAEFPAFLVNMAEGIKGAIETDSVSLQRLFATTAGAGVGFVIILILSVIMHFVMGDRKYVDSLRFTSVSIIPIAVMNGTLSHGIQMLLDNLGTATQEELTRSALQTPWGNFALNTIFYLLALWMLGRRTGLGRGKRFAVVGVGVAFMAVYYMSGLMITSDEWAVLLPKLMASSGH
jgi:hypothetical protein